MELTLKDMAVFGDECRRILEETKGLSGREKDDGMCMGWPPYTTPRAAGKLFGIGEQAMRNLARKNQWDGFPCVWLGSKMLIDVPGLYKWLGERKGQHLDCGNDGNEV